MQHSIKLVARDYRKKKGRSATRLAIYYQDVVIMTVWKKIVGKKMRPQNLLYVKLLRNFANNPQSDGLPPIVGRSF